MTPSARAKFRFPEEDPRSALNGVELVRYPHWANNSHPVHGAWKSWAVESDPAMAIAVYDSEFDKVVDNL